MTLHMAMCHTAYAQASLHEQHLLVDFLQYRHKTRRKIARRKKTTAPTMTTKTVVPKPKIRFLDSSVGAGVGGPVAKRDVTVGSVLVDVGG